MQFYEQDKILDLLYNTDQSAIFQVFEGIMPLEKMIAMIDYDAGNIKSVEKALLSGSSEMPSLSPSAYP